ncbi:hypothetical protein CA13_46800 [Planctomycetes bacterium CA13]|uniref:Uncharacterized protein n=1 Tax=Novipirellula herctigrandis TaxID=2527986 RepID=A0A5C5Z7Z6_9BACT|nr:hypothetical protein CA13_46800 [Planctomycetes bacterium CA13]
MYAERAFTIVRFKDPKPNDGRHQKLASPGDLRADPRKIAYDNETTEGCSDDDSHFN